MASLKPGDAAVGAGDGAADAPGGGVDANVDDLADDLEAHLISRDEAGTFTGQTSRRRRPKEPRFTIIEAIDVESTSGTSTAGDEGGSTPQYRTWLIREPVRGWNEDGWRLSTLTTVRALPAMPCHEVYVRSTVHLVPGTDADEDGFLASVKHVAKAATRANETWDTTGANSSFRGLVDGQELDDADARLVLRQAAGIVRRAAKRVADGYVALVERSPAHKDRGHCASLQALPRQRSVAAVADYRRKGAAAMRFRWRLLLRAIGAGKVALMRRILELNREASGTGRRASRVRLSWGSTQMRLLPTPAQSREERRRGFDDEDRILHFFFARRGRRKLERRTYVRESCTDGIRRYRCSDGREKRLRSHTNKYWQQAAAAGGDDADDVSADEDDGFYNNNDNKETEGCYAPMEKDPERIKQLIANSHSYLENDDVTGEERLLAVGFGAVQALQRPIDGAVPTSLTAEEVATSTAAVPTFAADGGCIRSKMITAFTVALAWPHLQNGRTHLVPVAYSLSGEKDVEKFVSKAVRDMLQDIMQADFTAPDGAAGVGGNASDSGTSDAVREVRRRRGCPSSCWKRSK